VTVEGVIKSIGSNSQFRFRSTKNKTTNVEFFFNDGSLTGNELLYQLKDMFRCSREK